MYLAKPFFQSKEEIKAFPDKQKLRETDPTRCALQKKNAQELQGEIK